MLRIVFKNSVLLFIILFALALGNSANALTVSPVRIEMDVDPGGFYTGDYRLTNDTSSPRTYYNSFQNFRAEGESGTPYFVPEETGLASWMSGPSVITLEPFETRTVPFDIQVPADAEPGGYFSAIFWMSQPAGSTEGTVSFRLGILTLLRVNGDIKEEGGIVDFETPSFTTETPHTFSYLFQNDGNDRLLPKGNITIKNLFGMVVEEIDGNPQEGNVLPLSKRRFDLLWQEGDVDDLEEELSFFQKALYQLKNFHLGVYTATLDVTYGADSQLTDKESEKIVIIPIQLLIILLVILIILCLIYKAMRRSMRKAVEKRVGDVASLKEKMRKEILKEEAKKKVKPKAKPKTKAKTKPKAKKEE